MRKIRYLAGENHMTQLKLLAVRLCLGVILIFAAPISQSRAGEEHVSSTPPSELSQLSQDDLNSFGLKIINEHYEIRSKVGKPSGDAPADVTSSAVNAVINLYDNDALIQRARLNYALTKKTYVPNHTGRYIVSNVALSRTSETVLVASFDVLLPDRVSLQSGNLYSGDTMPRILVLRWTEQDRMWKIVSHGDFDAPRTFLCGANKDFMPEKSQFKAEDIELAKELWEKVQISSLDGHPETMQSTGFQYVFSSGERKTAPGKARARLKQREDIVDIEAKKSGDLFIMRFDSVSPMTIDGQDVERSLRPRLVTFHHDADGQWRMNAIAVFQVTAKIAEDVKCVDP